jgi:hypothetical protein
MRRFLQHARAKGQSLVEFALALPVLMVVILVTIEFGLIFITYYSETRMVRENARWLAIRASSTTDAAFAQHVKDTMLPGLYGGPGAPAVAAAEPGDPPADSKYRVGNMTVWFTPCGTMTGGVCQHPDRAPGKTLHVEMRYDVSNLIFLPTQFRFGSLNVKIPTELPKYRVSLMVE